MAKKIPNLGPAEWDVLRVLWELGEASAREVAETLCKQRPLAQTTVTTLLNRLHTKELVRHRKSGRGKSFLYEATLDPVAVKASVLKRSVQQIYGDDVISAVSSLVSDSNLSPEQLRALRAVVEDADAGKSKRKPS